MCSGCDGAAEAISAWAFSPAFKKMSADMEQTIPRRMRRSGTGTLWLLLAPHFGALLYSLLFGIAKFGDLRRGHPEIPYLYELYATFQWFIFASMIYAIFYAWIFVVLGCVAWVLRCLADESAQALHLVGGSTTRLVDALR